MLITLIRIIAYLIVSDIETNGPLWQIERFKVEAVGDCCINSRLRFTVRSRRSAARTRWSTTRPAAGTSRRPCSARESGLLPARSATSTSRPTSRRPSRSTRTPSRSTSRTPARSTSRTPAWPASRPTASYTARIRTTLRPGKDFVRLLLIFQQFV